MHRLYVIAFVHPNVMFSKLTERCRAKVSHRRDMFSPPHSERVTCGLTRDQRAARAAAGACRPPSAARVLHHCTTIQQATYKTSTTDTCFRDRNLKMIHTDPDVFHTVIFLQNSSYFSTRSCSEMMLIA